MINLKLAHIILIVFVLFALSRLMLRLRDKEIRWLEFLTWLVVWIGVMAIVFVPRIMERIEHFIGIDRGIDFFVSVALVLLFYLLFRIYVQTEKMEQNMTKIVRKMAIDDKKKTKRIKTKKKRAKKRK